jgi:hypothetical protein
MIKTFSQMDAQQQVAASYPTLYLPVLTCSTRSLSTDNLPQIVSLNQHSLTMERPEDSVTGSEVNGEEICKTTKLHRVALCLNVQGLGNAILKTGTE